MQHPHLLPDDIELLVDGEDSPQAALFRQHATDCDGCRAELELALTVAQALEQLPHDVPAAGFQNRVMARVQVFEPWHVTLTDTVRRTFPQAGPVRALATAGAGVMALTVTVLVAWASMQADLLVYAARLALARAETAILTAGGTMISDMFGEVALAAIRDGGTVSVALGATALLTALAGATLGLRGLVALARRRGN